MKKALLIVMALAMLLAMTPTLAFAANSLKPTTLDNAPIPDYNYTRANKLPLTGYFEKSFNVNGVTRTAKIYISADAPIRAFFTVIAIADGIDTNDFIVNSGWKDIADANEAGLFILEPGKAGWGNVDDELAYLNTAIGFFRGNSYFSIFGENYLVGYGKGGTALEAWAAANPLLVTSQAYVDSASLSDKYYAQFDTKFFDAKNTGYKVIDIPAQIAIAYSQVPVPTWYVNQSLASVSKAVAYWKSASDCVDESSTKADYLFGSTVYAQSKKSDAWQTDFSGPISKVATLEKKVDIWDAKTSQTIYNFLTEYIRYDVTSAYGNQLGLNAKYGEINTMMVNGYIREYQVYVPDSAARLWPNGAPTLFVFAGDSQTDKVFFHATQWWKVADREGIILVIPCEQYSSRSTVVSHKDTGIFYEQLAKLVKEKYKVDPTRFYATGQSAGSMATQGFGMTNPEYFAAIATTSGVVAPPENATYAMVPTYLIVGEGDIPMWSGTLWDSEYNLFDQWADYYLKANNVGPVGDINKGEKNGRYTTYTWKNAQGFPLVKWTQTAWRAHNNIMAESPMLWDYLKLWSYKDGVRYYGGVPVANDFKPASLDNASVPAYNYTRANKLPLTGYMEKSLSVNGATRTAKVYIAPNASIRPFFTVISVPDGINTNDFILKSGWKDLADANDEGLFILEPGKTGWGSADDELAYINAAIGFFKSNSYFSIFGEHYLAGYGKGGTALEAWAAANPLFVASQAYINTASLSDSYYAQFGAMFFDGKKTGYKPIEIPEKIKIAYNQVPVPTWYVNASLAKVSKAIDYWKGLSDCQGETWSKSSYLFGSTVYTQSKDSDAWQTAYSGPISKVATLEKKVDIWNAQTSRTIYNFLTEYVRYDNSSAYGNQLAIRAKYGEIFNMVVNGYLREYQVYVPDSAAKLWPMGAPTLFVFAGDSQTDKVFFHATQWWKVADREGIILVIPCEQYSSRSTVVSHKDTGIFYEQLAKLVKEKYNVDPTRFYATGQSAGSFAVQGFGMTNPEYFAAIASTSGLGGMNDADWNATLNAAKYAVMPVYCILGEGDIEFQTGTLWDAVDNNLDKWAAYYLKANNVGPVGDPSKAEVNGRYTTWTWKNAQGIPLVKWTQTAYRAHNNIMAESPILWDYLKLWSYKDGIRYYDGKAVVK